VKLLIKPPELHPSLKREAEPIRLKGIDWEKFEEHGYRGVESVLSKR
jgi:hypothetical protein